MEFDQLSLDGAAPSVSTDLLDYLPASTATLTASGFIVGSTIEFQVFHVLDAGTDGIYGTLDDTLDEETNAAGEGHEAWTVTDGVRTAGSDGILGTADDGGDLDGIADGNVTTTWYVNPDDSLGATFLLTATGGGVDGYVGTEDDQIATNSFTDAVGSINKVYQHWADAGGPEWNNNILNDGKSDYFEGEVIPHVFVYKASNQAPLTNGQSYSFNITYNYYQQNTNAGGFDYITTYNISRTPGQLDATNPYIAPTADGAFTNLGGTQGIFYTVDANITNVSNVTYSGTGTKDGYVTVTFTYTGTTTTNGIAEIYYGLHIANPGAVPDQGAGPTDGANAWTGGSLQTTVDIGGSGATSIQLSPDAIIAGEISGMKFNDLDGDGVKDLGEDGLSGWTIFLDGDNDGVLDAGETFTTTGTGGTYTFSVTPDADKTDTDNDPYIVREVNQSGWIQTTPNPGSILITSTDPTELNVNFGNQQAIPPTLEIAGYKWEDADADSIWDAGESGLGGWTIYLDTDTNPNNGVVASASTAASGSYQFNETLSLSTTYFIYEDLQAGWTQTFDGGVTFTVDNVGNVTSTPPGVITEIGGAGLLGSAEPLNFGNFLPQPSLNIVKDAVAGQVADVAGEKIDYTISVQNTGNTTLTGLVVSDPNADAGSILYVGGDTDTDNALDVGETWSYTAQHTVTQAEIDCYVGCDGALDNIATADSNETDPDTDPAEVPVVYAPALTISKSADRDAVDKVGQTIAYTVILTNTGNVTLTEVTVDDSLLGPLTGQVESISSNGLLDVGETWTFTPTYNVQQSDIEENVATLSFGLQPVDPDFGQQWDGDLASISLDGPIDDGDIDNTATADTNQTDPQQASAEVDVAGIDVQKFVSVDNGTTWWDADDPTGPDLSNVAGFDPQFKFVVTNTGNVALYDVTLMDDNGTADTGDDYIVTLTGLTDQDGDGADDLGVGAFATGSADYAWAAGQHTNVGTATGDYDVTDTQTASVEDTDAANYFGIVPAMVTNSSLCDFGENFNLIFTPDYKLGGGNFKLSDSNPGQFYYNVFIQGDADTITLNIPYPFTTQGANPIHVYDEVDYYYDADGHLCLTPVGELDSFKLDDERLTITLNDLNGNGSADIGETYSYTLTGLQTDDDGFVYINIHLDYGLEKTTGYTRSSPSSGTDNAVDNPNVAGTAPAIMDGHSYDFSAIIDGAPLADSGDSIVNDNLFKNIKGLGGLFQADDSSTADVLDEIPLAGQELLIFKSDGTLMGQATTDEDGWYYTEFMATGKQTGYKVVWDRDGDGLAGGSNDADDYAINTQMGGSAGKWTQVDFTVVDPVGYDPAGDTAADLNTDADHTVDSYANVL